MGTINQMMFECFYLHCPVTAYAGLECTSKWPSIACAGLCVYLVAI